MEKLHGMGFIFKILNYTICKNYVKKILNIFFKQTPFILILKFLDIKNIEKTIFTNHKVLINK
jgi:hypothetical protein